MLHEIEAWNSGLVLMQLQVDLWVRGVYQEFNSCPIKTLTLVNRKQNVEIAFGFKRYTAVSTFTFCSFDLLSYILLLFLPCFCFLLLQIN